MLKKMIGKDFNKYINDARIDCIVQNINNEPAKRQYKINVLWLFFVLKICDGFQSLFWRFPIGVYPIFSEKILKS